MFNTNASGLSASDVLALTDNNGFGGQGSLWFIIILFLLFGGWGANSNSGAQQDYVLATDFATLQRQIDSSTDRLAQQTTQIANGISSLGYDQLSQINGINTNILTNSNAIQSQIASCCCNNREAIAGLTSSMQSGFCQTNFNNQSNTRDIIDSQNAGTQAIIAKLNQMESNAQQDKINTLTAENQRLAFASSQERQNAVLINALKPQPVPAFPASQLYGYYGTTIS